MNPEAVKQIYEVKGRPAVKPLSLMISGKSEISRYAESVPEAAEFLADRYWPGPLTIVLKAKNTIPDIVLAGGKTVGLRCPDHPLTLQLICEAGTALAAPSANLSGGKSPVCAENAYRAFSHIYKSETPIRILSNTIRRFRPGIGISGSGVRRRNPRTPFVFRHPGIMTGKRPAAAIQTAEPSRDRRKRSRAGGRFKITALFSSAARRPSPRPPPP